MLPLRVSTFYRTRLLKPSVTKIVVKRVTSIRFYVPYALHSVALFAGMPSSFLFKTDAIQS